MCALFVVLSPKIVNSFIFEQYVRFVEQTENDTAIIQPTEVIRQAVNGPVIGCYLKWKHCLIFKMKKIPGRSYFCCESNKSSGIRGSDQRLFQNVSISLKLLTDDTQYCPARLQLVKVEIIIRGCSKKPSKAFGTTLLFYTK